MKPEPAGSSATPEDEDKHGPDMSWNGAGYSEEPASPSGDDDHDTPPPRDSSKPAAPLQKRRRVTRACDECRRKKIKCDGKQPCTHCTVYSYGESMLCALACVQPASLGPAATP